MELQDVLAAVVVRECIELHCIALELELEAKCLSAPGMAAKCGLWVVVIQPVTHLAVVTMAVRLTRFSHLYLSISFIFGVVVQCDGVVVVVVAVFFMFYYSSGSLS